MARYALIIGIAEYTGSFPSLNTPVDNANAIADLLDRYGDFNQVKRLPFRREPGQSDLGRVIRKPILYDTLVQELRQFLQDANGSEVLIYYSGHGFTKIYPASQTPEGYLAPSDCQVKQNPAGQIIDAERALSLFDLNELIKQHQFSSLVVILDCCNAGAFLESSMVRRDVAFSYQSDYYLITACRASSKAYEGEAHSLLTQAVLRGLAPDNASPRSGKISGNRLFDVIGNELRNSRQEPIHMGWGRMITLVTYPDVPQQTTTPPDFNPSNPYMGLKAFEREQAEYFFGREVAVRALLERLAHNRFVAVIGPSGCGKSSLVKAGLFPNLEANLIPGSQDWRIASCTPGQYPLQSLTQTLAHVPTHGHPLLLFVDQFEELFTLCPQVDEQRSFIQRLNELTSQPDTPIRVIIAMRGDFLDRCAKFQESADLINNHAPTTYMVTPLTEAKLEHRLRQAMRNPARLHGVSLADDLIDQMVADTLNQPGAMPLLQYALRELWETAIAAGGATRELTLERYQAIGGVKGALQRWADQFYANLSTPEQAFLKELMGELVQIGEEGEVTRRRAPWERLRSLSTSTSAEQRERIIGSLVHQRLLVADEHTVEVAHEALLSESPLIQGWIEANRENIRLRQYLELFCRAWCDRQQSEADLLNPAQLVAIEEWLTTKQPPLTPQEQEFIQRSQEKRDRLAQADLEKERQLREAAEQRELAEIEKKIEAEKLAKTEAEKAQESEARAKAEQRGKKIAIAAGLLAVFASGLGVVALSQQNEVKQQQALKIGTLIGKAEQLLATNNQLEALTASIETLAELKEVNHHDPIKLERINQIISSINERNRFNIKDNRIYGLSANPHKSILAFGGSDKNIQILDFQNGIISNPIPAHQALIRVVRFSPDGNFFASGSLDKTIKIWSEQGKLVNTLNFKEKVYDVSFSANSRFIAATGNSRNIIIWDITKQSPLKALTEMAVPNNKEFKIYSLDFHPKNNLILVTSGYGNYDFAIWNLEQKHNSKPRYVGNNKNAVESVRFSNSGDMIVSCDEKGFISIWKYSGDLIARIDTKEDFLFYTEFSPDSRFIASVSINNTVKIWDVDEAIRVWQAAKASPKNPYQELETNTSSINRVSFIKKNDESQMLATASEDGNIGLWEMRLMQPIQPVKNHNNVDESLQRACILLKDYARHQHEEMKKISKICRY